jgi:hypothetical protein
MASNTNIKLSNVIGAPFADYVLRQLAIRASNSSTGADPWGPRTEEQVLYLANKTAWVRLISSIDIAFPPGSNETLDKYIERLGIPGSGDYKDGSSLAKNWVLQAGATKYFQTGSGYVPMLRQGIGPDGAYGLGGTQELGYRPMPGLTSVTVDTVGRLGSLRTATISFKVWNMNQLNTVEALYFRLGYSMLLEWGHTQYYKNYDNPAGTNNGQGVFVPKDVTGLSDPFQDGLRKEIIQQEIEKKKFGTSGNYDGMLGIVSNFNWSLNQEGGYDCSVKLVGLGAIMDSIRINQAYKLPPALIARIKNAQDGLLEKYKEDERKRRALEKKLAAQEKQIRDLAAAGGAGGGGGGPTITVPKNTAELLLAEQTYDSFTGTSLVPTYGFYSVSDYQRQLVKLDYAGIFTNPPIGPNVSITTIQLAKERLTGLYLSNPQSPGSLTFISTNPGTEVTLNTDLFNQFKNVATTDNWGDLDNFGDPEKALVANTLDVQDSGLGGLIAAQSRYAVSTFSGNQGGRATAIETPATSPLRDQTPATGVTFFTSRVFEASTTTSAGVNKSTKVLILFQNPYSTNSDFEVLRTNLIRAVKSWEQTSKKANIVRFEYSKGSGVLKNSPLEGVTLEININVLATLKPGIPLTYSGLKQSGAIADPKTGLNFVQDPSNADKPALLLPLKITLTTNNVGFIASATPPPPQSSTPGGGTSVTTSDASQEPEIEPAQKESYEGFESALHAMLTSVQYLSQENSLKQGTVSTYNLTSDTQLFYTDGVFEKLLALQGTTPTPPTQFSLLEYAAKGFSSQLMLDNSKFNQIPYIGGDLSKPDFTALCTSMTVKYKQLNLTGTQYGGDYQVYIPLGYLLAFINNMCLFYDSKQETVSTNPPAKGTEKRPYVYVDYNPETNFCLTSPQQFSVDPNVCLIPAQLKNNQYLELFTPEIAKLITAPFKPEEDTNKVSVVLNKSTLAFKSPGSAYQGKTMHIMVCTQYLLRILKEYSTSDPQHAVALQPFLERVMRDINKALGNVNAFRVAYRDDTNTIQIQDDQYVPPIGTETNILIKDNFYNKLKQAVVSSGELPIFSVRVPTIGSDFREIALPNLGIARQMQLKTVMSTRLASMIAISAQSATGSVNAKDHTALSWLNKNFRDRYKPYVQDADNGANGSNNAPAPKKNNRTNKNKPALSPDQEQAVNFNLHVKAVYEDFNLSQDAIDPSKNYYIERMSKVKSRDENTIASPFIPAELELTLDGISGIIMGNAFNIPPNRLPLSLRGSGKGDAGLPLVGFIVNGLIHKIENNEWTTTIKGQMIKLREQSGLGVKSAQLSATIAADPAQIQQSDNAPAVPIEIKNGIAVRSNPGVIDIFGNKCDRDDPYSKAPQIPEGSINSTNFPEYAQRKLGLRAPFQFKKNPSNINLNSFGLTPLTQAEIIDVTQLNRFDLGVITNPPRWFVIHHTAGRQRTGRGGVGGAAAGTIDTFYCRGYPAQYVISGDADIYRFMPDGAKGWHVAQSGYNSNSIGVEIQGGDDTKITAAQTDAAIRLAHFLGFSWQQVVGHGGIQESKADTEGYSTVKRLNPNYKPGFNPKAPGRITAGSDPFTYWG